jgi:hypothetical protein
MKVSPDPVTKYKSKPERSGPPAAEELASSVTVTYNSELRVEEEYRVSHVSFSWINQSVRSLQVVR